MDSAHSSVQHFYSKKYHRAEDFGTTVTCTARSCDLPGHIRNVLAKVPNEIVERYLGCGPVIPECLDGANCLDLGCGSGRDAYILARLAGPNGHITGVDMIAESLEVAKKYEENWKQLCGYPKNTMHFIKSLIEDMDKAGVPEGKADVIVSNCVVNLCPDKGAVLRQVFRALRPGGEFYFSDMYADSKVPDAVSDQKKRPDLWSEGLGGALHWPQLFKLAKEIGFAKPRLVRANEIQVTKPEFKQAVGNTRYCAATFRLFKMPESVEDYPADSTWKVTYNGKAPHNPEKLILDHAVILNKNEVAYLDAEISAILSCSRFARFLNIERAKDFNKQALENPFDLIARRSCKREAEPPTSCHLNKVQKLNGK